MAQSSGNFANVEEGSNNLHYHSLLFPSRSRRINNKYILECEDPSGTMLPAVAASPSLWWKSCTEVHNISFIIFLWWVSLEMKEGIKVRNWCKGMCAYLVWGLNLVLNTHTLARIWSLYIKSDQIILGRVTHSLSFMELDAVNWRSGTTLGPLPCIPHVLRRHSFNTQEMFVRMWQTILLLLFQRLSRDTWMSCWAYVNLELGFPTQPLYKSWYLNLEQRSHEHVKSNHKSFTSILPPLKMLTCGIRSAHSRHTYLTSCWPPKPHMSSFFPTFRGENKRRLSLSHTRVPCIHPALKHDLT